MTLIRDLLFLLRELVQFALIIYVVSSWIPQIRESSFYAELNRLFSLLLDPIRRIIPPIGGVLDISPIILIFLLNIFFSLLENLLGFLS